MDYYASGLFEKARQSIDTYLSKAPKKEVDAENYALAARIMLEVGDVAQARQFAEAVRKDDKVLYGIITQSYPELAQS
jgi:uncharacterized protein HemY